MKNYFWTVTVPLLAVLIGIIAVLNTAYRIRCERREPDVSTAETVTELGGREVLEAKTAAKNEKQGSKLIMG